MNTIPFTLGEAYAGFADCHGLLHNQESQLCLEYQVQDGIVGVFKGDVRRVCVPLDEIASVTLTKGWLGMQWFGIKLVLQATHLDAFCDVPGAKQGRVELQIARADNEAAEAFVWRLHETGRIPEKPARA